MTKNSSIEWTDHTFNPWWGCAKVSPGCKFCYAEGIANRFGGDFWGVNGNRKSMSNDYWSQPQKWDREAASSGKRARVFCGSMCDIFEDRADLDGYRLRLWDLINNTPNLDWLLLTKRPENIFLLPDELPANIWLGASVENQDLAKTRIPEVIRSGAAVKFLSCEPLLGPLDLSPYLPFIDWVIVGGESGPHARPMAISWARAIKDQCQETNKAVFIKQLGGYPDKRSKLENLPVDLRIRDYPITSMVFDWSLEATP